MRMFSLLTVVCCLLVSTSADAQQMTMREREDRFELAKPVIGDLLPSVEVYTNDGQAFKTDDLRGHYTVLTFGCLT